jgi:hypothetical protein
VALQELPHHRKVLAARGVYVRGERRRQLARLVDARHTADWNEWFFEHAGAEDVADRRVG